MSTTQVCSDCVAGKYQEQNNQASASCKFCAAGTEFDSKTTACSTCAAGKYQHQNDAASVTCKTCNAGEQFKNTTEACEACPTGKFQDETGVNNVQCKFCAVGKEFTGTTTACSDCAAGKYQDEQNTASVQCKTCRADTTSDVGSEKCTDCKGVVGGSAFFYRGLVCIDDSDSRFEDAQNDTSVNTKTAAVSITTAVEAETEMVQFENDYKISTTTTASNRKERTALIKSVASTLGAAESFEVPLCWFKTVDCTGKARVAPLITGSYGVVSGEVNVITSEYDSVSGGDQFVSFTCADSSVVNDEVKMVSVDGSGLTQYEDKDNNIIALDTFYAFDCGNTRVLFTPTGSGTIEDATTPVVTSAGSFSLAEMTANRESNQIGSARTVGTMVATDTTAGTITFAVNGTDKAVFSIDANTGVLEFNQDPNYESPQDADSNNRYDIVIEATNVASGMTGTKAVEVLVTDVAEVQYTCDGDTPGFLREALINTWIDNKDNVECVGIVTQN